MQPILKLCTVMLLLSSVFIPHASARDRRPEWLIDLRPLQTSNDGDAVVRLSGKFVVIYPGAHAARLVLDSETHQPVPEERLAGIALPPREEPLVPSEFDLRDPDFIPAIIARRKEMTIVRKATYFQAARRAGWRPQEFGQWDYYLEEPGKPRVLIFRSDRQGGRPVFLGDNHILMYEYGQECVVVDKQGKTMYKLREFSSPQEIIASADGTRFAVRESWESLFHRFAEFASRYRVSVFRSSDGKKLFSYQWHPSYGEDRGFVLSEDGSLLGIVREQKVWIFTVPTH